MKVFSDRNAFALFHYTLGLVVLYLGVVTVWHALHANASEHLNTHAIILGSAEAVGTILFLIRKTIPIGSIILLIVFAVAIAIHGFLGEVALLVYAAGVILVWSRT